MILITAATGQVGGAAVRELVRAGVPVRALVRDPARVSGLAGVEVVHGSYEDEASLDRALRGVASMLLAGRDSPGYVDLLGRVLSAAGRAGVGHVVALSAIGACARSPIALMRDHASIEQRVCTSPSSWTLLRPHLYLQNLLRAADAVRVHGRLAAPMGDLRVPFVDTADVGSAAATILRAPAAHAGETYALTGPVASSYDEVAAALGRLLGRDVVYEAIAPEDYESALLAAGVPGWRASDLAWIASAYDPRELVVSRDLPVLLGRSATSLDEFLEAHREAFRSAGAP